MPQGLDIMRSKTLAAEPAESNQSTESKYLPSAGGQFVFLDARPLVGGEGIFSGGEESSVRRAEGFRGRRTGLSPPLRPGEEAAGVPA